MVRRATRATTQQRLWPSTAAAAAHKGRFLLHFDDGQRERVQLPDDTVRIMTACVSVCRCKRSPGGAVGCCEGADGSEKLPRPWEADPK